MRVGTQGLFRLYLKTFVAPFLPARLTAPGSPRMGPDKKFKGTSTSTDQQLFRGELARILIFFLRSLSFCLIFFGVLCLFSRLLGFARDPPISDFAWFLRLFKWQIIYVRLSEAN